MEYLMNFSIYDIDINGTDNVIENLRKIHTHVPLFGITPNDIFSLPDDMLRYLIACIRNLPSIPEKYSLQEWNIWYSLLKPHRILPLIAYHIHSWPKDCLPPSEIFSQIIQEFNNAAGQAMLIEKQLHTLIEEITLSDIPIILLKGQSLANTIYPDPALRPASDIDILTLPEHMKALKEIFEGLGYYSIEQTFDISPNFYKDQTFYSQKVGYAVEAHWAIDCNFDMFHKEWIPCAFKNRRSITGSILRFDTLNNVDNMVYLTFHHIFKHDAIILSWILDFAYLMKKLSPDEWEETKLKSVLNNVRIPIELAIIIARFWTGFSIPAEHTNFTHWPQPTRKELKIQKCANFLNFQLLYFVVIMFGLSDWKESARFIYWSVFPPKSYMIEYRRSESIIDIPCSHVRRIISFIRPKKR
jgi:hypothetical protein